MKKLFLLNLSVFIFQILFCQIPIDSGSSGFTTIHGTIKNFEKYYPTYKTVTIDIDDWTNAFRRTYSTEIDGSGQFSLSCLIFKPQVVYLTYKNISPTRAVSSYFVCPDDTLKIFFDADTYPDNIKYVGKTAKSCENLNHYGHDYENQILDFNYHKQDSIFKNSLSFQVYHSWRDSIFKIEQERVEKYLQQGLKDPLFESWLRSTCKFRYYTDILHYNNRTNKLNRSGNQDESKPLFIDSTYISLLITILKSVDTVTSDDLNVNPPYYFMFINSMYGIVEEIGDYYYSSEQLKIRLQMSKAGIEINKIPSPQLTKEEYKKKVFQYYIKTVNELFTNSQVKESLIAHIYTMALEFGNIDSGLDTALANVSNPAVKASLINKYNSYRWRTTGQNSLSLENEGDTILNYLRNKYKGYVQYLTIWRTWWPTNRFINIIDLNKKFENKNVAFVYLCYYSDKIEWGKIINKYKLSGEHIFLTNDQSVSLAKVFNLMEVNPRYVIMDKNGTIVNDRAPLPDSNPKIQNNLITELNKYLSKPFPLP